MTKINLDKVLFESPPYSHFLDVRESPTKIINKKQLTTKEILQESIPVLKVMAREYLFTNGRYTDYKQVIDFFAYITEQIK